MPLKYRYKTTPYSHQKRALAKLLKLKGVAGLFMEMGTGKTKVAIDWASICHLNPGLFPTSGMTKASPSGINQGEGLTRVLVIAPVSVMSVWKRQIRQHSPVKARIALLQGSTSHKARLIRLMTKNPVPEGIEWIVINYESLWRDTTSGVAIEDLLIRWKPHLVIADESHKIKSATSRQSKSAFRIARAAPMKLALTGTPLTKSPLDVFGQFRFLNSEIFGTNWTGFKREYGIWGGFARFQLRGYKNLTTLVSKVRGNSFRIKKDQCFDLPPKVYQDIEVTLSPKAREIYKRMAEDMIVEFSDDTQASATIILTKLLRLSQITSGFVSDEDKNIRIFDDSKLKACMELVEDLHAQGEKVVIFVRFKADYERISKALEAQNIGYVILSGSVPSSQREGLVEQFWTNPRTSVFLSQIAAGSLGIDLTPASYCIFYSLDYRWDHYVQAVDRIHRHGQTKKCTYYHLVVPTSIDTLTLSILQDKGQIAEAIIHDPTVLRPKF